MLAAFAATGLGGCMSIPKSCTALRQQGISAQQLEPGTASSIAALTCRADSGDQRAQLALGKAFETGAGVPVDHKRAAELYRSAAAVIPEKTAIYSPPVRLGGSGRVLFLDNSNATTGLAEARYRLGRLYVQGRGVRANAERGRELIEQASREGFVAHD